MAIDNETEIIRQLTTFEELVKHLATKEDIQKVRVELVGTKGELGSEIHLARGALGGEIQSARCILGGEIQSVRTEIQKIRVELVRWIILTNVGVGTALIGVMVYLVTQLDNKFTLLFQHLKP